MPRIDPQQLLKCLSVLLGPTGGIKSKEEVQRLASLMVKFSKKLVSKSIYISILKATKSELLDLFMTSGGWDLNYNWLSDGVTAKNWPLVRELVLLLLVCPVDIDRLKSNSCPKLIKTLSKDLTADEGVRLLACKLVDHWLRIVKGDINNTPLAVTATLPDSVGENPQVNSMKNDQESQPQAIEEKSTDNCVSEHEDKSEISEGSSDEKLPVYKITIRDGKKLLAEISADRRSSTLVAEEVSSTGAEDVNQEDVPTLSEVQQADEEDEDLIKPVKLKKKSPPKKTNKQKKTAKVLGGAKKDHRDSTDSLSTMGKSTSPPKEADKALSNKVKSDSNKGNNSKNKTEPKNFKQKELANTKTIIKESEETITTKTKPKMNLSLKNKKGTVFPTKDKKSASKSEKPEEKEKNIFDGSVTLTDKEKESLSKLITPPISKVGKIPRKTSLSKEEKQSEEKNRTLKDDKVENKLDNKPDLKKNLELKKPEIKRPEKKYSISIEPKKNLPSDVRPKTVKTFNSKFRSTGLEEEMKPLLPRPPPKKLLSPLFPVPEAPEKKIAKRSSPPPEVPVPEKKPKSESPQDEKKVAEKIGGVKLIPAKPKPMFLQESDVFMDAMLAANTMKEPRKRKRRSSTSKETGQSEAKKDMPGGISPSQSPKGDEPSPSSIKPNFKFYQDTLDVSTDEEKSDAKSLDESMEFAEPDDDQKSMGSDDEKVSVKVDRVNGPLKGVLAITKIKKQKKSVTWKEEELESIRYFELDETERVNVTKNFADMKNMEREHERENVQIARKLAVDDVMEERTRWQALIPIDIAAPVVAPGKNSHEKDIQYAREKTVAAAIYFNKRTIPDSPAEPDLEIHAITDATQIPMDDITGSTDSTNDFTTTPWPEPRGLPPTPVPEPAVPQPPVQAAPPGFPPGAPFPPQGPFPPMGPFMPGPVPPGMPMPPPTGDCWRTGEGKVVAMPPEMFAPPGMMPPGMPPMGPGPMMLPPGVTPDMPFPMPMAPGPNPTPEEMAQFTGGFPPMGPAPPQMFGPPQPPMGQPMGGNWGNSGGGGNWFSPPDNEQQPPNQGNNHHNNNNNNSGRYQNNWRGNRGGGRNPDSWSSRMPLCNNIIKKGFCRNNNCRFRHTR